MFTLTLLAATQQRFFSAVVRFCFISSKIVVNFFYLLFFFSLLCSCTDTYMRYAPLRCLFTIIQLYLRVCACAPRSSSVCQFKLKEIIVTMINTRAHEKFMNNKTK